MKKKNPLAWTDDHRAREQGWKSLNLWHITCHQSIFRTKGKKILQTEETININAIINKTTEEADTSCSPLHSGKETYAEPRDEGTRECRTTKIPEESNGWMISLLMIENDIEKNGYEHGMKNTYTREPFLTDVTARRPQPQHDNRMDSHWRKDNWLSNLPPTQPYREVTAVPVVRSTYRELRQRTGHPKSRMDQFSTWGSRFQAQSPKIAFKGKSVEDQPEKSEKTDRYRLTGWSFKEQSLGRRKSR